MKKPIIIVNYGVGNLYNVEKAFLQYSQDTVISSDKEAINSARALVLPGVGSFPAGVRGMEKSGLTDVVKAFAKSGRSILGICLGAQLLLSEGQEFGVTEGLGIIEGRTVPFPTTLVDAKVPHIGWSKIHTEANGAWDGTPFESLSEDDSMYFLHSFIMNPTHTRNIFSKTTYGGHEFVSAIRDGNIFGCQFHPEKSGADGLKIIEKFVTLASA